MSEITTLAAAYSDALAAKADAEEALKSINGIVDAARIKLVDAMLDDEIASVTHGGYSYTITPKARYSKKAGADGVLFELLEDHGLGDLIKPTVNAQTLQSAMREQAEQNGGTLPEEWEEVINVYEYNDITRRKK